MARTITLDDERADYDDSSQRGWGEFTPGYASAQLIVLRTVDEGAR
jgi:hypothetical protein